jgi:tetratricopeptide (TPR) repeat protein
MMTEEFAEAVERGVQAHQAGRLDEALSCYRAALQLAPQDAEATSLLGLALLHSGAAGEALPLLSRAVELEPGQSGLRVNLVEGLLGADRRDEALVEAERAAASNPTALRAWRIARDLCVERRNWPRLEALAARWAHVQPSSSEAWRALAQAAFEQGRHQTARQAFERALAGAPASVDDLVSYASLCLHALSTDAAADALEQAGQMAPDHAGMLSARALLRMYLGRFAEAEADCLRSLALDPAQAAVYSTLSRLRRGRLDEAEIASALSIAGRPDERLDQRIPAAFAVAHARDAREELDEAFAAYERAHALALERDRQEGRGYDAAAAERRMQRIIELSGELAQRPSVPDAALRPIFIVGMPRSGTTLVESMLGAHSRVMACGERVIMRHLLQVALDAGADSDFDAALPAWRRAYFAELPERAGVTHLTDKHPLNFEAAGLIHALFPGAVLIDVRRNPLETCWSIYRQEFSKHWTFAHRFEDVAHSYGCYARLAAHWERTLGDAYAAIQYETLVDNFETAAVDLVERCGLEWEEGCLRFQDSPRAIATFSTVQARAPVAVGDKRAERYAGRLEPLMRALERAGVDPQTGALASR